MVKIIPYSQARRQIAKHLEAKDVKEAENVLGNCTEETRVKLYGEMSPQQLGTLVSRGDLAWTACELPSEQLVLALSHDPELIDEKGQIYPAQAAALAFTLADRSDAATLYRDYETIRSIVNLAFLVEFPASIEFDDYEEIEEWLSNYWLSNFEPDLKNLLDYDEEVFKAITENVREEAREEIRTIQRAIKERAEKVEKEMFEI